MTIAALISDKLRFIILFLVLYGAWRWIAAQMRKGADPPCPQPMPRYGRVRPPCSAVPPAPKVLVSFPPLPFPQRPRPQRRFT